MGDLRCASVLASGMAKTLEWRNGLGGVCPYHDALAF